MQPDEIAEDDLFSAILASGARALLIGRRAMVALGFPVLTADYDFWIHIDDIEAFNAALGAFAMFPSHTPEQARERGRYVIENGEHVDVLVARSMTMVGGDAVQFEEIWDDRVELTIGEATVYVPSLPDLIRTKRFSSRDKDECADRDCDGSTPELSAPHLSAAGQIAPEEFRRRIEAPLSREEIEDTQALVEWFMRRYPTPLERLRYIRRKHREWTRRAVVRPRALPSPTSEGADVE